MKIRTRHRGNVVDDWALVAVGPCVPVQRQRVAGVGSDVAGIGQAALVARDVCRLERGGLDEAIVLVQSLPAGCCWRAGDVVPVGVLSVCPACAVDSGTGRPAVAMD